MPVNSRAKGANFEREIGNLLVQDLNLTNPVKRILEQTRTKELPDLRLGRWCIECKRYGDGGEPPKEWWDQVLRSCSQEDSLIPALVYKFNRRPIKVRILAGTLIPELDFSPMTIDLMWEDFVDILRYLFQVDIEQHESSFQV